MGKSYRGPSIDAKSKNFALFCQVVSEEKIFKNRPNRNNWDEMSNLNRGPSIDAFYEKSVHLA